MTLVPLSEPVSVPPDAGSDDLRFMGLTDLIQPDEHASSTPTLHELPVPTKENDWLGFCHSAMKLQNGDRKVTIRKLYISKVVWTDHRQYSERT